MKKISSLTLAFFMLLMPLFVYNVSADKGVGVGTGKIELTEKLEKGGIYKLASITVFNTGDEPSEYNMSIQYHSRQSEMEPDSAWFEFSPSTVTLSPGQRTTVDVKLSIPVDATAGRYFAYIEASPFDEPGSGNTAIGVAAATKVYFEVDTASQLEAFYTRAIALWQQNEPWTTGGAALVALLAIYFISKKYVKVTVSVAEQKKK